MLAVAAVCAVPVSSLRAERGNLQTIDVAQGIAALRSQ